MSEDTRAHLVATGDDTRELLESLRRHLEDYAHRCETCQVCREYPEATPSDSATTYLDEWPLELVRRVGTPLAVVLGTGGPHCEIVRDVRRGPAYWVGSWGSETVTNHADVFAWALAYWLGDDAAVES